MLEGIAVSECESYAKCKHPAPSVSVHRAPIAAYQEAKRQLRGALDDTKKEERVQHFLAINLDGSGATDTQADVLDNTEAKEAPLQHWLATPLRMSAFCVKVE